MSEREALERIRLDPYYLANLDWGRPRLGHPEGSLRFHIEDLEANLSAVADLLPRKHYDKLILLAHVHDICKPEAWTGVPSHHPQHHGSLARDFLARYLQDPVLLAITQFHDEGYYLYLRQQRGKSPDLRLLEQRVLDLELFLLFNLIDHCHLGKNPEPLQWLLQQFPLSPLVEDCYRRLQQKRDGRNE